MSNYKDLKIDKFKDNTNIVDSGTEGFKVPVGTTAQRGSTTGQWRFNSTTGFFEGISSSGISSLEPDPAVTSVDDADVDSAAGGNQTIVVTGQNFTSGGVIAFVGSTAEFDAATTTFNSTTQVTAVAPKSSFLNAQEPYKVKFTSNSGKIGISSSGLISVDNSPTWSTSAGNIGTVFDSLRGSASLSATASDPEGDTVAYSLQSGSLPAGASLNSSSGAITGFNAVGSDTTSTFTLRATAGGKTADRQFNIVVKAPVIEAYTSGSGTWNRPAGMTSSSQIKILVVAGGGGAGGGRTSDPAGGGGAGGLVIITNFVTAQSSYSYSVGGKGNGGQSGSAYGSNGSNSTFASSGSGTVTANGGGGGGGTTYGSSVHGNSGGSGGGSGSYDGNGGSSNQTASFTIDGTTYSNVGFGNSGSGGNGGAGGGAGGSASGNTGGSGKNVSSDFGTSYGNSGVFSKGGNDGSGGNASSNTGNGGGSNFGTYPGGNGGSGIILIAY
jgi:hypothetical protein